MRVFIYVARTRTRIRVHTRKSFLSGGRVVVAIQWVDLYNLKTIFFLFLAILRVFFELFDTTTICGRCWNLVVERLHRW